MSAREFFSLKQIADAARAESWATGRALEESRKLLRRKRRYLVTRNRQADISGADKEPE